jgi:hypothetical protein
MSRVCTVCLHARRRQIDLALVGGTSMRGVAAHFGLSEQSIRRHFDGHVTQALKRAASGENESAALELFGSLSNRVEQLIEHLAGLLRTCESTGEKVAVIRELRGCMELMGKVSGKIIEGSVVVGGGGSRVIVYTGGVEPPREFIQEHVSPGSVVLIPHNGREDLSHFDGGSPRLPDLPGEALPDDDDGE